LYTGGDSKPWKWASDISTVESASTGKPQQRNPQPATFSLEIQALRALAVTLVVVYHLWPGAVRGGYLGVDIFFVISGYLITSGMLREYDTTGRLSLANFYARRARRILPAATVAILSTAILTMLFVPNTWWQDVSRHARGSLLYFENFLLAHDSVDYLAQNQSPSPFQHFWSLSVEEQFYLLWPVLFVLVAAGFMLGCRLRAARASSSALISDDPAASQPGLPDPRVRWVVFGALAVLTAASFAYSVALVSHADPSAYFVTPTRFWELGLGALLAFGVTYTHAGVRAVRSVRILHAGEAIMAAVLVTAAFTYRSDLPFPGAAALLATAPTAALIYLAARNGTQRDYGALPGNSVLPGNSALANPSQPTPLVSGWALVRGRIVENKGVQWLGDVSYSLYLWHWPLVVMAPFIFRDLTDAQRPWLVLALSLGLAHLSRRYIELPCQRGWVRSWRPRWVLAAVATTTAVSLTVAAMPGAQGETQLAQEAAARKQILTDPPANLGAAALQGNSFKTFVTPSKVLVPALQKARRDVPEGSRDGTCKSEMGDDFTPECDYGPDNAELTIALVGDSHIEQYIPAFQGLLAGKSLRIKTFIHASCPFSTAVRVSDAARGKPCLTANKATLAALLHDDSLDLVVTSNSTNVPFDTGDAPTPEDGFIHMWTQLEQAGKDVVVLSDNPWPGGADRTRDCVAMNKKNPTRCEMNRNQLTVTDHQVGAAKAMPNVQFVHTTNWFCTDTQCPAVIGNVLVYRDDQHITSTYAATLTSRVQKAIPQLANLPDA